jgi:tetratricopeptide (TPR) repeat protein
MAKKKTDKKSKESASLGEDSLSTSTANIPKNQKIRELKKVLKDTPQNSDAYVELWDIYVAAEAWEALVGILKPRIKTIGDDQEKIRLLTKLGTLYDEKIGDTYRAVKTYQQILDLDPHNRRAIWTLAMLYYDLEEWEKVIEIFLLQIELSKTPEEKLTIRSQLAQIYEQRLKQEEQALMEYIQAARLAPQNVRILLNLEKLATRTESFHELLAVYEDVVEHVERVELRIALYLKLARLYTKHLTDSAQSKKYCQRALELSQGSVEKLFSIANIYGEEGEWEELIATYLQLIHIAKQPDVVIRLRHEVSRLYRDGLHDLPSAFRELIPIARAVPRQPGLLKEIIDIGLEIDEQTELISVLEEIANDHRDAQISVQIARLLEEKLDDPQPAIKFASLALEFDSKHVDANLLYFDLLENADDFSGLANALEEFVTQGDLTEKMHQKQSRRLAKLYEKKLNNRDRAVEIHRNILQEPQKDGSPPRAGRNTILEQLYRRQGAWEELTNLLGEQLDKQKDPRKIEELTYQIVDIQEVNLENPTAAFECLATSLARLPKNSQLTDRLLQITKNHKLQSMLAEIPTGLLSETEQQPHSVSENSQEYDSVKPAPFIDSEENTHPRIITDPPENQKKPETMHSDDELTQRTYIESVACAEELPAPANEAWKTACSQPNDSRNWETLAGLIPDEEQAFSTLSRGLDMISDSQTAYAVYRKLSLYARTIDLRLRLAKQMEKAQRLEDAESSYRIILRENSSHSESLDGLFRIYKSRGALERYDAFLTRARRSANNPKSRLDLLWRRASLRAQHLDRTNDAIADLESLFAADQSRLEALSLQEEILKNSKQYQQLAKMYQRHFQIEKDPEGRTKIALELADLYCDHLKNDEQAIYYYKVALEENPGLWDAYERLTQLLEKKPDWLGALTILRKASEHVKKPELVGRIHARIGKILEEHLLRASQAEEHYRQAAEANPPSAEGLQALINMVYQRSDWGEWIRLSLKRAKLEKSSKRRAKMYCDMALVWKEKLSSDKKALQCYEEAHKLNPNILEAAQAVAESRLQKKRHNEAHELLERVVEMGQDKNLETEKLAAISLKHAQSAEAVGLLDKAEKSFIKALELSPADQKILTQYGYHLSRRGLWERALEVYQKILENHSESLAPNQEANVCCLMAHCWFKQKDPKNAANCLRQALLAVPGHTKALRASIDLSRRLGRDEEVADLTKRLLNITDEPKTRFNLSFQLGNLLAEKLHRYEESVDAFRLALEEDPKNIELLEKLRRILVKIDRFEEASEYLETLSQLAESDIKKSRYLRIAGDIERERLNNEQAALDFYLRALFLAPLDKRAHSSAVRILYRTKDWRRLVVLYEQKLKRIVPPIDGQKDPRVPILDELYELYRDKLKDRRRAIEACEQLIAIGPPRDDEFKVNLDLALLYEEDGLLNKACDLHRKLTSKNPLSVDSYHALRRIYKQQGHNDKALGIIATLDFLNETDSFETKFLSQHRQSLPIPTGKSISEAQYHHLLLHPGAKGLLDQIFSFIGDYAHTVFTVEPKDYNLKAKDLFSDSSSKLASIFKQAASFLSLHPPEAYSQSTNIKGIMSIFTSPPAIIFSQPAVQQASVDALRFMAGRAIAFCRPENLLAATFDEDQLNSILLAIIEAVFPGELVHSPAPEVLDLAEQLSKTIPTSKVGRLQQLAYKYREQAEDISVGAWQRGVEHTCNRAGFALSGNLKAAVSILKGAKVVSPSGDNRALIRELVFYSISDEYFTLREELGVAIK